MAWEIDRRFLVRVADTLRFQLGDSHHLRQGCVRKGEPSVRIRVGESQGATLTCKSGVGIRRPMQRGLKRSCLTTSPRPSSRRLKTE